MNPTFGFDQEHVAYALRQALASAPPASQSEGVEILRSREVLLGALSDRVGMLDTSGVVPWRGAAEREPIGLAVSPAHLTRTFGTVRWMDTVLRSLPRLPEDERVAPLEALQRTGQPLADQLRVAAGRLLSGTDTLERDATARESAEGAWAVVHDLSVALEAVVVLDSEHLAQLLHDRCGATLPAADVRTIRMTCASVERYARMSGANSEEVDRSVAPSAVVPSPGRIVVIEEAGDFLEAHRRLAGNLQLRRSGSAPSAGEAKAMKRLPPTHVHIDADTGPRIDRRVAFAVMASLGEFLTRYADDLDRRGGVWRLIGEEARAQAALTIAAAGKVATIVERPGRHVTRLDADAPALLQAQELKRAVEKVPMIADEYTPVQAHHVLRVTHAASRDVAMRVLGELQLPSGWYTAPGRATRADDRIDYRRMTFAAPLVELRNRPEPPRLRPPAPPRVSREGLKWALEEVPDSRRPGERYSGLSL